MASLIFNIQYMIDILNGVFSVRPPMSNQVDLLAGTIKQTMRPYNLEDWYSNVTTNLFNNPLQLHIWH